MENCYGLQYRNKSAAQHVGPGSEPGQSRVTWHIVIYPANHDLRDKPRRDENEDF